MLWMVWRKSEVKARAVEVAIEVRNQMGSQMAVKGVGGVGNTHPSRARKEK
jgi:hypothetical protein